MSIVSPSSDRGATEHTPIPRTETEPVVHHDARSLPTGGGATAGSAPATVDPGGPSHQEDGSGRSRRRLFVPIAAVALAGAGVAAFAIDRLGTDDGSVDETAAPVTLGAFAAEQRDLIDYTELDGTLTYADRPTVAAGASGTITAVADDGEVLERGSVGFEIDARPVTVFHGTTPLYRELTEGAEGLDVLLVEQNLAALGYHATYVDGDGDAVDRGDDGAEEVDTGFTVDGVFDAATTDAVLRWQADLGVEETGTIGPNDVIVTAGPAIVSSVQAEVGTRVQDTSPVIGLSVTATETTLHAGHEGEVELLIASGPVADGAVLYTVDDLPVTAIVVDPAGPLGEDLGGEVGLSAGPDRTLSEGVSDGPDVEALETMLVALGYDADGDLDVDEEFDEDTTTAVTDWQEDLQDDWDDVTVDGVVEPSQVIWVPAGTTVDRPTERENDRVARGGLLFSTTGSDTARIVETTIPAADQDTLVEGQEIEVRFPDGSTAVGTVTDVASSSVRSQTDPDAEAEIPIEISVPDVPDSATAFSELDVDVLLADEVETGATVVPVSALVVTETGYAVEVPTETGTTFVAVEPGMFADGFVQVDGIEPGTVVVTP